MAKWYYADNELNYVESLVLVTIVFLELLFDGFWHFLSQPAAKSYRYGDKHEEAYEEAEGAVVVHPPHHVQLYKELVNKMGAEFMSLGFIAFTVFCANQLGLFESFAENLPSCGIANESEWCVNIPYTAIVTKEGKVTYLPHKDWLHLVELVHVQLFVGMMLYFVLMFGVVHGSVFQIKAWENLRLRRISTGRLSRSFSATLRNASKDADLRDYVCLREYLVVKVLEWKKSRPKLFKQVTNALGMVSLPEEEGEEVDALVEGMFRTQMEVNFAFSSYLALNVESAVRESIALHTGTWITIIVLFTALALGCHYAKFTILGILPFVVSLALLVVLTIVTVTGWRHRTLAKMSHAWMEAAMQSQAIPRVPPEQQAASAPESHWIATCKGRGSLSPEKSLMRFLQIFLFVISYVFARTLIDFKNWQENPDWQAPIATFFALLFMLLLFVLPAYVPVFLELMALPPFLDKDNLGIFLAVIDEGFATRFKHEGSVMEKRRRNSARSAKGLEAFKSRSLNSMTSMVSFWGSSTQKSRIDPSLVAISELVSVLESCTSIDDLRTLRENLESQLPHGVLLPECRSPPEAEIQNESF